MASEAAKKALEEGDVEKAATLAVDALDKCQSSGDLDGMEKVMKVLVESHIATDKIEEAKSKVKEVMLVFKDEGNKPGQAHMMLFQGELECAEKEPEKALESVTAAEGLIPGSGDKKQELTQQLLHLQVNAQLLKGNSAESMTAAKEFRSLATKNGDKLGEAVAWHSLANAYQMQEEDGGTPADALQAAEKSLALYQELGNKKGEATVLNTVARAQLRQDKVSQGLKTATQSLDIFRELKLSRGMVSALETIVQAQALADNPMAGLVTANKELSAVKAQGSKRAEADLLDMITSTHAMLGQPRSAMRTAQQALDLYMGLGDKIGEGGMLHTMAEMQRSLGNMVEATDYVEKSLRRFKAVGCKWGEDQAVQTLSVLLVQRGQPEKSPKRGDVQRALKELAKAIEQRKVEDFKAAEEKLDAMESVLAEGEVESILNPILAKDPSTVEFLEAQGWKFKKDATAPCKIRQFPHKGFYLHMIMTGMNFGPQFQVVHPYRVGNPGDEITPTCLSVSQLPETEAWQMEMGYRPGLLDSCLQCQGSLAFP